MTAFDADRLIREAALGRESLAGAVLQEVLSHVARAGFDSVAMEQARGNLAGIRWRGVELRGSDWLPPAERHYLKHAVRLGEWPPGTSLAAYLRSLEAIITDATSGVFTSLYQGEPQLGVMRQSRQFRGPEGFDWMLVEYRVTTGHWVTGYQPRSGLRDLESSMRTDLRWWREPEHTSG